MEFSTGKFSFNQNSSIKLITVFNYSASHVVVGGLSRNYFSNANYQSIYSYLFDEIDFCLRRPKPIARWEYLFTPFSDYIIWIVSISHMFVACLCCRLTFCTFTVFRFASRKMCIESCFSIFPCRFSSAFKCTNVIFSIYFCANSLSYLNGYEFIIGRT